MIMAIISHVLIARTFHLTTTATYHDSCLDYPFGCLVKYLHDYRGTFATTHRHQHRHMWHHHMSRASSSRSSHKHRTDPHQFHQCCFANPALTADSPVLGTAIDGVGLGTGFGVSSVLIETWLSVLTRFAGGELSAVAIIL